MVVFSEQTMANDPVRGINVGIKVYGGLVWFPAPSNKMMEYSGYVIGFFDQLIMRERLYTL